jgi:hypothetical protein
MHFLNPYAALYSLTLIPIVLFYFLKQEKLAVNVSSIIPWRELTQTSTSDRKRFKLEILFLLQLLVIFTLVLALIRFYLLSDIRVNHRVFILDASASMLTREKGGSRLDKAKAQALKLIETMPADDRVMLIRAGNQPQRLTPFLNSKAKLKQVINQLKGGETTSQLAEALRLIVSLTEGAGDYQITIFTDHEEPGLKELAGDRELQFRLVGERRDNVAITALDVYQGLYDYSRRKAYIGLRNFSPRSQQLGLRVYLDQHLQWEKELELAAGESTTLPFGYLNQPGLLSAEVVIDDALKADNAAYALIGPNRLVSLLAVTADQKLAAHLKRIAQAIPGLKLALIAPEQYTPPVIKEYDIVVFHQLVPQPLPDINALYVMPPPDNPSFKVQPAPAAKTRIMDWDRRHPTLKYLNFLDELTLDQALRLSPPTWANVLLEARDFPLAWEGEYRGHRLICLGFELGDYLFPPSQDISMVVLLLNMLDWLTPQSASLAQLKTGDKYILQHDSPIKQAKIKNPKGEEIEPSIDQGVVSFGQTDYVGVYELSAVDVNGRQIKRRFVANLLDEAESDIAPAAPQEPAPTRLNTPGVLTQQRLELWPYIILLALLFLFIEWWVYFRELG